MPRSTALLFALSWLPLTGCPSTMQGLFPYPSYVDPAYKGKSFEKEILLVLPVSPAQVTLGDAGEFEKLRQGDGAYRRFQEGVGDSARRYASLPADPQRRRERYVAAELTRVLVWSLDSRLHRPAPFGAATYLAPDPARDRRVRGGGCQGQVPPRAVVEGGQLSVRFVLVLDAVNLAKHGATIEPWGTAPQNKTYGRARDPASITASAHYLLYDYANERVVACGEGKGMSESWEGLTRDNWDGAIIDLANHVPSPF